MKKAIVVITVGIILSLSANAGVIRFSAKHGAQLGKHAGHGLKKLAHGAKKVAY